MVNVHKESQETKDFIADWIHPEFFFSKKDVWHRFGMLGVFGDFVLSCTRGNIAEIGTGESSIYLSHLARKWGRKFYTCDIAPAKIVNPATVDGYLKPKGENFELADGCFYDDGTHCLYAGESDEFFKDIIELRTGQAPSLALSFIDGDHLYPQARKDFFNMAERTVENGYIILHDTHPPEPDFLREERCGDVYKLRQEIEINPRFDCITLPQGCAINVGLTIVRKKPAKAPYYNE